METYFAALASGGTLPPVYQWGIETIRAFQSVSSPALTAAAVAITRIGDPLAYIVLLALLYWCVDERSGFRIAVTVFLCNGLNITLKESLRVDRPFTHYPDLALIHETGWSTPSGHAQNAAAFWPLVARLFLPSQTAGQELTVSAGPGLRLVILLSAILPPFAIGLTRIYLGVHYPTDVLFGWATGFLVSLAVLFALPVLERFFTPLIEAASASARSAGRNPRVLGFAAAALGAGILNSGTGSDTSMGGAFFGFVAGYTLLVTGIRTYRAATHCFKHKILRALIGLGITALVYFGLAALGPDKGSQWYPLFRFIRYALTAFQAAWVSPLLFMKLKLA